MLNKIFIMGRLTRDPELRRTQSGTAVTSFSLAVDRDFKSQSGEKETDFIDVVAWRSTAEFVSSISPRAAWPWWRGGSRSVTGKTRRATTAEVRRWLPTMSISVTADPAVPVGITAVILRLPPTVLPPEGIPPRWAARPILPRSTRRTATCRSDVPRHMKSL